MKITLQSTFDPIQNKAKKAFINAFCSTDQTDIVRNNDPKPLTNHPNISQTGSNQQAAETSWVSQMALMDMEATAFLVGKEGLNLKSSAVKSTGLVRVGDIGNKENRFFIAAGPPANQSN